MTTDDRRPTTDDRRPTTDDRRTTNDERRTTTDDRRPTTFLAVLACIVASCSDEPGRAGGLATHRGELDSRAAPAVDSSSETEVLRRSSVRDGLGQVVSQTASGSLTLGVWQRAARPSLFMDASESTLYTEMASGRSLPDGTSTREYVVTATRNAVPVSHQPDLRPTAVARQVSDLIASGYSGAVSLDIVVRDFADWDLPPMPPDGLFDPGTRSAVTQVRTARLAGRLAELRSRTTAVRALLTSLGGHVVGEHPGVGGLTVFAPLSGVAQLAALPDIRAITLTTNPDEGTTCDLSCPLTKATKWKLGDARAETRLDFDSFLDQGYHGGSPNLLTAAVVEPALIEDESRAFNDNDNVTSKRITGRFSCTATTCSPVTNFADGETNSDHGTMVSAALLGDYEDGQAKNIEWGDDCYDGGADHCPAWELASSGAAPEARLHYYTTNGGCGDCTLNAFATATTSGVATLNFSSSIATGECDITTDYLREHQLENAFDEGIFVTVSAGNNSGPSAPSCNVNSPADVPKVFAVNAFTGKDCLADYRTCPIGAVSSAKGGGDLVINGVTRAGVWSVVDVVAPNYAYYLTKPAPNDGLVDELEEYSGTSAAAPQVAGAAMLVKSWFLDNADTWINSPGRLQAVMLAMTDRYYGTTPGSQKIGGMDTLYGAGRVKLRLLQGGPLAPTGWNMTTRGFTSGSASYTYAAWATPIPSGAELLKCVMNEPEDMSSKDDVSDLYLTVTLRAPVGGVCSSSGSSVTSLSDSTYDLKHMVAFETTSIQGKCPYVTIHKGHVTSLGATANVFCYYAGVTDDEPN